MTGGPGANAISLVGVTVATVPDSPWPTSTAAAATTRSPAASTTTTSSAGTDDDRIIGDNNAGGTRDLAEGEAGDDTLVWNPGDGDDINEGGDGIDTIEVNGGGGGEVFTVKPSTTVGRIAFDRTGPTPPGPFNLDIGTASASISTPTAATTA